MEFNAEKFVHIQYSHPKVDFSSKYLCPLGNQILSDENCRDLGVKMSATAKFSSHIEEAVNKATRQSGWILRTFSSREPQLMIILFKQLVVPLLEFCCQVWCPVSLGEIRKIEAVQRNFTSKIDNMDNLFYWSRIQTLSLYSLERRRERYLILYVFKIMKGIVPNFMENNLKITFDYRGRRGLLCNIPIINRSAMAKYKTMKDNTLAVRGPVLFNCLPSEIRDLNLSLPAFKRRLDGFLKIIPDKPSLPGPQYAQTAISNSIGDQLEDLRRKGICH